MAAIEGWDALSSRGTRVILALDYGLTRAESTFADLAVALGEAYAVWVPHFRLWLDTPSDGPAPTDTLVTAWLAALTQRQVDVAGIFGYCAGATLAQAIARRLVEAGRRAAPVVLFDPQVVDPPTMLKLYADSLQAVSTRKPEVVATALRNGDLLTREAPASGGLFGLADGLIREYLAVLSDACADRGLPAELERELGDRVVAYLRYLAFSSELPAGGLSSGALTIQSFGYPQEPVFQPRIPLDVPHVDLLRRPETATLVRDLLAAPTR